MDGQVSLAQATLKEATETIRQSVSTKMPPEPPNWPTGFRQVFDKSSFDKI
jgi:hypothetical protein